MSLGAVGITIMKVIIANMTILMRMELIMENMQELMLKTMLAIVMML